MVISLPTTKIVPTKLATLMMPSDLFPILATQPWCAGLCRVAGNPGPMVMVRVSSFGEEVKSIPMTLALTFCHMRGGGLFHLAARFDSKPFGQAARRKISVMPPVELAVAEWVTSLDSDYDCQMIAELAALPEIRVVVCGDGGSRITTISASGERTTAAAPKASHELVHRVDPGLAGQLKAEWESLAESHRSVDGESKDFQQAQRELGQAMPADVDPVLPKP